MMLSIILLSHTVETKGAIAASGNGFHDVAA